MPNGKKLRAHGLEMNRRNERLNILSEAFQHLLSSHDQDHIVRDLFPKVAAHLGVDAYFNYMVDPEGGLRLHSYSGIPAERARTIEHLSFGQSICGTVAHTKNAIVATNILNSDDDEVALVRSLGFQALACNPLITRDKLLGTLSFASRTRSRFAEEELDFMRVVSHYVALAMDRAATEERLRDNQAWIGAQKAAFQAAMDGASLATSLGILVQAAKDQARDERRCAFYIADAQGKTLHHVTGMPEHYAKSVDGFVISPESLSCGLAVALGQPIITSDVLEEPRWAPWLWLACEHDFRGCWSFPIQTATGKMVGTFAMYFREPRDASGRDRELAAALTQAAAIIISQYREKEERRQSEEQLRESERKFREVIESLPAAVYTTDAEGHITMFNQAAVDFSGRVPKLGADSWCVSWRLYRPDGTPLPHEECPMARSLKEGRPFRGQEAILEKPDGTRIHFIPYPTPLCDAGGKLVGGINMLIDITERKRSEERQRLLINELQHRVKNTLASVQAIMQHTLRNTRSPEEFAGNFSGRILSLSRVHSMLSATQWNGADLLEVIRDQLMLGVSDDTRVTTSGPSVQLKPQMALHLALMLHELGTNSRKYGALSNPEGSIRIGWNIAGSELRLNWTERGGPPVNAPTRRGFGTTLIEESAKGEGGSARLSIESAGFAWEIVLPMPRVSAANVGDVGTNAERLKAERGPEEINGAAPRLAGKKLLVIEDETLVALEIMENLEDAGAHVLGPVGNPADALQVIESESFDATLLDANLHGKPVDEIAAALTRRQLPFAFVTGYGRESLPRTFGTAAILNNPLPGSSLSRPRVLF